MQKLFDCGQVTFFSDYHLFICHRKYLEIKPHFNINDKISENWNQLHCHLICNTCVKLLLLLSS